MSSTTIMVVNDDYLPTLQEGAEKQEPRKPIGDLHRVPHYKCPRCHGDVKIYRTSPVYLYCHHCGQRLDWSDTQEEVMP